MKLLLCLIASQKSPLFFVSNPAVSCFNKAMQRRASFALFYCCSLVASLAAQTLLIPARSEQGLGARHLTNQFSEPLIPGWVALGYVPQFLTRLCPVNVTNISDGRTNIGTFHVAPDYLAIGNDDDYLLTPLTPRTAQGIADSLACTLPTRKMVDAIYAAADVKLEPQPIPSTPAMTTFPVFAQHNEIVRTQRAAFLGTHPLGALVAGHKKDVVISAKLSGTTNKVAIYGWHRTNGAPIQPLYTGHSENWVDYSHGIRLVSHLMFVNGKPMNVASVLADPKLCGLISDEGVITHASYSGTVSTPRPLGQWNRKWPEDFLPGGHFGEMVAELQLSRDVRVHINAPSPDSFAPNKPVLLIFYALPNGNTIEQTIGKTLQPGDDWHFDIQHIGAQTRFLRHMLTNQTVVVAYLENSLKSWPAWRRKFGDTGIRNDIFITVKQIFTGYDVRVVFTGHSGGGSLTFGLLNSAAGVPSDVERIAFLDSNYAYATTNHLAKLTHWLKASTNNNLTVLAYDDANALLEGKSFVSAEGGTWGRSHAMLRDLGVIFPFTSMTNDTLRTHTALDGRIQFLLKENPDRKILHTVQVERNGFIHAMLTGTPLEGNGYEYLGPRAYTNWIAFP
ncbi:MAG: hypothetical protein HOP33_00515 [Verrucomicrobia bacterium]|nr:hypothetical protein [Verrucomicrobiota bacterium]